MRAVRSHLQEKSGHDFLASTLSLPYTHLPGLQDSAQTTTQQQKGRAGSLIGDGHLTTEPCCGKTGTGVWRRESTLPIFLT